MEGDATFLSRNQRPVFVHGFVQCPEGRFDILKLHNRSNETILDVTLTTTDCYAEALLRRNLGIAQGSPLRVLYDKRTERCKPNALLALYRVARAMMM